MAVTTADERTPATGQTGLPPLIPREILFGNPERTNPQLSPDGKHLAYLAPDEKNVLQVWLQPAEGGADQPAQVLTADKKRGIHSFFWTYLPGQATGATMAPQPGAETPGAAPAPRSGAETAPLLIYAQDADGDENFHLFAVDAATRLVRDVTPFQGIQARMVARDPRVPDELLVGMNVVDRRKHDVYRLNLRTGACALDTDNPGNVLGWTADAHLQVRAATAATPDGGTDLLVRETVDRPWKTMRHWGPDDEGHSVGFSADGATLYIAGSHDANTRRLLALDVAGGAETVLAEDPAYDAGPTFFHPTKRIVQAVAFHRERLQWQALDPSIEEDFAAIAAVRDADFHVASRDLADNVWLVAYTADDGPTYFYRFDRASKQATLLFSNRPKLEGLPLAHMQPIEYQARDGLIIHGYLTTPVGIEPRDLPAVLLVHGGPWGRDVWGFHTLAQWLANRGYAVLQVNFRASTGYGKAFVNAGDREWGGKMHDDLVDAVHWLIAQEIADPKRAAIMGGSYGGYATLAALAFSPDLFAAGVELFGPSNIVTLIRSIPPYWAPMRAMLVKRMGDPDKDEAFLRSRSPLFFADRIKAPLLIGQGANDARVPERESEQIVQAMRAAGRPVEYLVYADEGHGFVRPENNLHFFARAEEFLAKHLGGRCEPAATVQGHSAVEK